MELVMKHPGRAAVLGLILAAAALMGVTPAAADTPNAATTMTATAVAVSTISISNFSFQPAVLAVKAGTKVIWINHDTTPHTVTSSDKRFISSGGLDTGDQYSVVFDKPGVYEYFCSLHPMTVGKVIVQPSG